MQRFFALKMVGPFKKSSLAVVMTCPLSNGSLTSFSHLSSVLSFIIFFLFAPPYLTAVAIASVVFLLRVPIYTCTEQTRLFSVPHILGTTRWF